MADKRIDDIVKRLDRMETKLDELRESWWKFEGARLAHARFGIRRRLTLAVSASKRIMVSLRCMPCSTSRRCFDGTRFVENGADSGSTSAALADAAGLTVLSAAESNAMRLQ